jgi:hypothetical protein
MDWIFLSSEINLQQHQLAHYETLLSFLVVVYIYALKRDDQFKRELRRIIPLWIE